jgi:hypothetical protein
MAQLHPMGCVFMGSRGGALAGSRIVCGTMPFPPTCELARHGAPSPSGKAEVCKTSIPGSNPGGASTLRTYSREGRRTAGATLPEDLPLVRIDPLSMSSQIEPISVRVVRLPGSDHQAVAGDIEFRF